MVSGHSMTIPLLVFMLCVLAAVAVAHIFENLRPRGGDRVDFDSLEFDSPLVASGHGHAYTNGHAPAREPTTSGHSQL
jgi:hypothetical protein